MNVAGKNALNFQMKWTRYYYGSRNNGIIVVDVSEVRYHLCFFVFSLSLMQEFEMDAKKDFLGHREIKETFVTEVSMIT